MSFFFCNKIREINHSHSLDRLPVWRLKGICQQDIAVNIAV